MVQEKAHRRVNGGQDEEGGSVQYGSRGLESSARKNQRNNVNRMVNENSHRRVNGGQE